MVSAAPPPHRVIELRGQLVLRDLELALAGLAGVRSILVDATKMTGYDVDARDLFVARMRALRPRVAIVHDRPIWGLVIATMSLASGIAMKSFSQRSDAEQWLAQL